MKAVIDANVLFDSQARDLLLQCASQGLYEAIWSEAIEKELFHAFLRRKPHWTSDSVEHLRFNLRATFLFGYSNCSEQLIASLQLPDPMDRHVLGSAITASAEFIVTYNLKDFPEATLLPHGIKPIHPADFFDKLVAADQIGSVKAIITIASRMKKPPNSPTALAQKFISQGWTCMEKILPLL